MSVNDLLSRAREYIYDRENLDAFVAELVGTDEETRKAVAEYLSGHGLAIARMRTGRRKPGPWFWLDEMYIRAIAATLDQSENSIEAIGWGTIKDAEALEALPL